MGQELWAAVDGYFNARLAPQDEALHSALAASEAGGLPSIQIAAGQGQFLLLLARAIGARSVLEIGTLGGYSTIWLARALPSEGRVVSCELSARHAAVARSNLERAGLAQRVDIRVGRAADTLAQLHAAGTPPFDLVFIDADKASYPEYLRGALRLSHPGTLIVADNVVRQGRVLDEHSADADVKGIRAFIELLGTTPGLLAVAMQTVGERGHDGFALALVGATAAAAP